MNPPNASFFFATSDIKTISPAVIASFKKKYNILFNPSIILRYKCFFNHAHLTFSASDIHIEPADKLSIAPAIQELIIQFTFQLEKPLAQKVTPLSRSNLPG